MTKYKITIEQSTSMIPEAALLPPKIEATLQIGDNIPIPVKNISVTTGTAHGNPVTFMPKFLTEITFETEYDL